MSDFPPFIQDTRIIKWEAEENFNSLSTNPGYKVYARMPKIDLTIPVNRKNVFLKDVLLKRESHRDFSSKEFDFDEVSEILYSIREIPEVSKNFTRRTYPSAGALYPIEVYLISLNCDNLEKGVFHYSVRDHSLTKLLLEDVSSLVIDATNDEHIDRAACVLIFTIVYNRFYPKYGQRGIRYALIELGHLVQNINLTITGMKKGCYEIGGFIDTDINELLDIREESEGALLMMALGNI